MNYLLLLFNNILDALFVTCTLISLVRTFVEPKRKCDIKISTYNIIQVIKS